MKYYVMVRRRKGVELLQLTSEVDLTEEQLQGFLKQNGVPSHRAEFLTAEEFHRKELEAYLKWPRVDDIYPDDYFETQLCLN